MAQFKHIEVSEPFIKVEEKRQPQLTPLLPTKEPDVQPARPYPSYHSTPLSAVNALLDGVDRVTGGRAGLFQRLFSYLFFGGSAAVVNLIVFFVMFYLVPLPVGHALHNIIAFVVAAEISIMTNFIPNDYFTFRHLAGRSRSWTARCTRFHITSIVGSILTFLIEFGLHMLGHVPAIIAEAIAIILVLFYNFTFHHLFTYRQIKSVAH